MISSWRGHHARLLGGLVLALWVSALTGVGVGAVTLPPGEIAALLARAAGLSWGEEPRLMASTIFWSLRLPRVLAGMIIGAALSIAGAALQGVFRNPLADPGLIGVSSGAVLAVVLCIVVGQGALEGLSVMTSGWVDMDTFGVPLAAFLGALGATSLVLRLGLRRGRVDVTLLILAGVALNALTGSVIGLLTYMADDKALRSLTIWTLGSLSSVTWREVGVIALCAVPGMAWLVRQAPSFDLLLLGESEAYHLGLDAHRFQRRVILVCALIVGVGVGFTGMIGFVGLVVPHMLRLLGGASHRYVLLGSVALGGALLVGADTIARTVAAPAELPLGVLTALIGAPFFIYLLRGQVLAPGGGP